MRLITFLVLTAIFGDDVASVSITPNAVTGGESATGTVNLSAPAPAGGTSVTFTSNNPSVVVQGVRVAQGQTSATFPIASTPVTANANATVTATVGKTSATTTLTVNAPCVVALVLQLSVTNGVAGDGTLSGTIGLNGTAPSGGITVNLISGGGNIGTVVVAQGKTSDAVKLNLADVTQLKDSTVTAQSGSCTGLAATVRKDL